MKNGHARPHQTARRFRLIAYAAALAVARTVAQPCPGHADKLMPPLVPSNIQVPAGNKAFLGRVM
jgi:hypothetical protein